MTNRRIAGRAHRHRLSAQFTHDLVRASSRSIEHRDLQYARIPAREPWGPPTTIPAHLPMSCRLPRTAIFPKP